MAISAEEAARLAALENEGKCVETTYAYPRYTSVSSYKTVTDMFDYLNRIHLHTVAEVDGDMLVQKEKPVIRRVYSKNDDGSVKMTQSTYCFTDLEHTEEPYVPVR